MEVNGLATINSYVKARVPHLEAILPKSMSVERFTKIALQSIAKTPRLAECSAESLYISMHSAAQLGLEPNGPLGHAFLVPYWNSKKNCYECQFQAGWRGLVALADRTCEISVEAFVVRKGDKIKFVLGTNPSVEHESDFGTGEITHVYAVAHLKNGRTQFEVMSAPEVNGIMQRTKSKDREGNIVGSWRDDWGEMARKTVVKRLCKYLPLSPEMADAIDTDNRADFEEIPEVHSEPTKTWTEQVKEQLKAAQPVLNEPTQISVGQEEAGEFKEPTRRGRKSKDSATTPKAASTAEAMAASEKEPAKASGGSPVAATQPAGKTVEPVTTPAAQTNTGEIHEDIVCFERALDIGMNRTKFIDSHESAMYSESILVTTEIKKGMSEKKRVKIQYHQVNGREIIVDARIVGDGE